MKFIYLLSVYLHILSSILWIGGLLFLMIIFIPALKNHPDRLMLIKEMGLKFRKAGWIALGVLLITGIFNLYMRGFSFSLDKFIHTPTGHVAFIKILLFLIIIILSAIHDFYIGPKSTGESNGNPNDINPSNYQRKARILGRINFFLALIAAAFGVILVRGGI